MAQPGEVYFFPDFVFRDGGERDKYVVILAVAQTGDYIIRLLTSQIALRQADVHNPCSHASPCPGYFLEYLGGILPKATWVDLRELEDFDRGAFDKHVKEGKTKLFTALQRQLYCQLLHCTAQAGDTTFKQSRTLRDQMALIGC